MNEFGIVRKLLLDCTKEGWAFEWVTRIECVVRETDLNTAEICWHGSPNIIAFNVCTEAERRGLLGQLRQVLEGWKSGG